MTKSWFESYWWSPNMEKYFGSPWDRWNYNGRHKTLKAARAACFAGQVKQPEIWYDVREVRVCSTLQGNAGKAPRKGPQ